MALPKRFIKKTRGINAQVFVAKAINYTADATIAAFIATTNTLGEFGVYDGNEALHTDLITSAEFISFALKTTLGVKRTPRFKLADVTIRKQAYVAPVKPVMAVGWSGTGGSIVNPTIAVGQIYNLKVIETTEGQDPFPTWNYQHVIKTGEVAIDIVRDLAKQINDPNSIEHQLNNRMVSAKVKSDATYGNFAITGTGTLTMVVTNGSDQVRVDASGGTDGAIDAAIGDLISFDAAAAPTDAIGDIYKVIAKVSGTDDTTLTLDRPYQGATQTFTEAEGEGTRVKKVTAVVEVGIELTAIDTDTHFRLAVTDSLANAAITTITAFVRGNGTYEQVKAWEEQGQTFAGDTTKNAAFTDKFGKQDSFAVDGETYDIYNFEINKTEQGVGIHNTRTLRQWVVIAVAKSTGNVDTTLDTLFAL